MLAIAGLLTQASQAIAEEPVSNEQILSSIRASKSFLQKEGRIWFNGENEYQEQGCVSCHQVPSGVWSLASAGRAIDERPDEEYQTLLKDALDHIADPKIGRPAMWSQLLISSRIADRNGKQTGEYLEKYLPEILKSQEENGRWQAKGQFPSQRRPIIESDAVITMWMLKALEGVEGDKVQEARKNAQQFLETVDGNSSEWLAWMTIISKKSESEQRLIGIQNDDGGWGWAQGEPSNAFSTGIALFALVQTQKSETLDKQQAAIRFLIEQQGEDGTWRVPSRLITKKGSDSLDYIYHYWSTAWATIGLSQIRSYDAS